MPSSPLIDIQLNCGNPDGKALEVAIEPGAEDLESMRPGFLLPIAFFKRALPKALPLQTSVCNPHIYIETLSSSKESSFVAALDL